jgi:hypothetical protein
MHFEYEDSCVVYENGDSEQLLLTNMGPDLYRLEESSLLFDAVYGDIIRVKMMADGALLFVEIAERSNLTTQRWILGMGMTNERIQSSGIA